MLRDLVNGFRQLRRSPGFALAAILTLALAIGANTAIYQVLDAVIFRLLPVREPQSLVRVQLPENGKPFDFSYPLYREMAVRQQVAEGLFVTSDYPLHAAVLRGRGVARTVGGVLITSNYFDVLGVPAQIGRVLTAKEDAPVAVISDRFWSREFTRSANALGQTLLINKAAVTIVGVAARGFTGDRQGNMPDVWLPIDLASHLMTTGLAERTESILAHGDDSLAAGRFRGAGAGGAAVARAMRGMLFGIGTDAWTAVGVAAFVLATFTVIAAWLPARRAARLDPMDALRQE